MMGFAKGRKRGAGDGGEKETSDSMTEQSEQVQGGGDGLRDEMDSKVTVHGRVGWQ